MSKIIALLFFVSSFAQAHVEPGTHRGQTPDGKVCELVANTTYFEKGTPHPLNERIEIVVDGATFLVGHPPVIDFAATVVHFNHDVFHGVLATPTGAKALEIRMSHAPGKEGPAGFTMIENFWKTGVKSSVVCEGLSFVP
ncbi:MAG: hypothetical protein V4760_15855 [Bdellovibrionota bacterium]